MALYIVSYLASVFPYCKILYRILSTGSLCKKVAKNIFPNLGNIGYCALTIRKKNKFLGLHVNSFRKDFLIFVFLETGEPSH